MPLPGVSEIVFNGRENRFSRESPVESPRIAAGVTNRDIGTGIRFTQHAPSFLLEAHNSRFADFEAFLLVRFHVLGADLDKGFAVDSRIHDPVHLQPVLGSVPLQRDRKNVTPSSVPRSACGLLPILPAAF